MESKTVDVPVLEDLRQAYDGSYYTIAGAGGDLSEWVEGLTKMLEEEGIGKPTAWYQTTGGKVNDYAFPQGWTTTMPDAFQPDLVFLMFPLDGLHGGKLPLFKLKMEDRWFDDIVQNMRAR